MNGTTGMINAMIREFDNEVNLDSFWDWKDTGVFVRDGEDRYYKYDEEIRIFVRSGEPGTKNQYGMVMEDGEFWYFDLDKMEKVVWMYMVM